MPPEPAEPPVAALGLRRQQCTAARHTVVRRSAERRWNHYEDSRDQGCCAACTGIRDERGHDPVAATRGLIRQDQSSQDKEEPHPFDAGCGSWREAFDAENRGCGQCPHIWLRAGPYIGRIGPDSACFRDFPVVAGPGVRFESHLGHVFSLVRGVLLLMCGH